MEPKPHVRSPRSDLRKRLAVREGGDPFANDGPNPKDTSARVFNSPRGNGTATHHQQPLDIELAIAEKMYQTGMTRQLFMKFDRFQTGKLSPGVFQSAVAAMGIMLKDEELNTLLMKYDLDGDGHIWYTEFLKIFDSRLENLHTSSQAAFSSSLTGRSVPGAEEIGHLDTDLHRSKEQRVREGIETMREKMEARNGNLRRGFMELDENSDGRISLRELISGVVALGFPHDLCTQNEVLEYASSFANTRPGTLNYSEFVQLFLPQNTVAGSAVFPATTSRPIEPASPRKVTQRPEFIQFKTSLKSLRMKDLFFSFDTGRSGLVPVEDLLTDFRRRGLSASVCEDPSLMDYILSFGVRNPGYLTFSEFVQFIQSDPSGESSAPSLPSKVAPTRRQKERESIPKDASAEEAVSLIKARLTGQARRLREIFDEYDLDRDGTASADDIVAAMDRMNIDVEPVTVRRITGLFRVKVSNSVFVGMGGAFHVFSLLSSIPLLPVPFV